MLAFALAAGAVDQGLDPSAVPRVTPINEAPAPEKFAHDEALIETAELAKLLESTKENVVVLDARDDTSFRLGHITAARNLQSDLFQDPARPPYFMPPQEAIKRIAAQEGISASTRLVIYDEDDGRLAARIWFTFHAHGHDKCSILNGGVAKWRIEQRAWSVALPTVSGAGTFEPLLIPRGTCGFDDLSRYRMRVHTMGKLPPVSLLDARARAEYTGEETRGVVGGHIPGAANLPWTAMMSGKESSRVWKSPQEIYALLRVAGVEKGAPLAIYDQAGGRSAHLYFTLYLLGFSDIRNYVGGWREYSTRPGAEIEK